MPTYEITGANGKKYRVTGENPEGALAALKKVEAGAPSSGKVNPDGLDAPRSFAQGMADIATFGLADEAAAAVGSLGGMLPGGHGKGYSVLLDEIRGQSEAEAEANPGMHLAGQVAGGVGNAAGLVKGGLSLAGNALKAGEPLKRVIAASAADGGIASGLYGFGSGEGTEDRVKDAVTGVPAGMVVGAAAPLASIGLGAVLKPIVNPIWAALRPDRFANAALGERLRQSGRSVDDVVQRLEDARADNQPMYMAADAMGHAGQRLASTVARNPNESRQAIVDALDARQAGQGRRIATNIGEAFDAPDTAAQRSTQMTDLRDTLANKNYGAARAQAGPVDISPTLKAIDDVLTPGVHSIARPNNQIANDSIEGALSRVRSMISDGRSNLTDFNALFRVKLDLDDMIARAEGQGAGNRAHALAAIRNKLDDALADSSAPYANARDQFKADSRAIDAIETGKTSARRGRPEDTIERFNQMNFDERYGFRGGYADPLIEQAQTAAPGVNKARPLLNDATTQEFPVFAMPGEGDKLARRLTREDEMFQTRAAATGNSKTADNLSDAADLARFDPSIMEQMMHGRVMPAATMAVARALNAGSGQNPRVLSRIAEALMETDPVAVRGILDRATSTADRNASNKAIMQALMMRLGAPEANEQAQALLGIR